MSKKIHIGMPLHQALAHPAASGALNNPTDGRLGFTFQTDVTINSSLPDCFNRLFSNAINNGADYFCMIHGDVCPQPGWFDPMFEDMQKTGADIISAVIPIRNFSGLTSTALDQENIWTPRRMTLKEVYREEPTFHKPNLLLNTGLMIIKLKTHIWKERFSFRQIHRVSSYDGKWFPEFIPEDWDMSREIRSRGGLLFATRRVPLYHGTPEYHNREPWGPMETDHEHIDTDGAL